MLIEYRREGPVALLAIACPPVNAFCLPLRQALVEAFARLRVDDDVRAVVVHGTGKGFSAGGDIAEFGKPEASTRPTLSRDVLAAVETCGKPVVAAVHGFAIGGGLEFALACHARVAVRSARVGLPEVTIGRIPLSGSQRLPRLIGIECAADWMLNGATITADHPDATLVFDRRVDRDELLLPAALDLANAAIGTPPLALRQRAFPDSDARAALRAVEERYPPGTLTTAQRDLLAAIRAAVEAPDFQSGLDRAQQLFDELIG